MRSRKLLLALGLASLIAIPAAMAAMWPNFPIIGSAAYCGGFATGTTGQVCNTTVPAGPTRTTGSELIPTDTHIAQGAAPQTALLPVPLAASGSYQQVTPTTGQNHLIANNITNYLLTPAGTLSTLTVRMPTSPYQGQIVRVMSSATITTLTLSGSSGQTISNAPTALTISTTGPYGYGFMYVGTVWYRVY